MGANPTIVRARIFTSVATILLCAVCEPAQQPPNPQFTFNVVVKESDSGQPISQARVTLTFQTGKLHRTITYNAKTNAQGKYTFTNIPKGTIHLFVTAERHQSFGKEFELQEDNQEFEIKLKKPQPLL